MENPQEFKPLSNSPEQASLPPRLSGDGDEIVELESVSGPPPVAVPGLAEMPEADPASGRWKEPTAASPPDIDAEDEAPEKETVKFARKVEDAEMDMTPMVDIVFQLLIFFMVTASFSLQRAKEIPKPKEDRPSTNVEQRDLEEADSEAVVVHVDENGTFLVVNADGDEEEAPSEQELRIKMKRAKESGSLGHVTKLIIKASGEAFHERVVIALDVGTEVGMERVTLQTVEDEGK